MRGIKAPIHLLEEESRHVVHVGTGRRAVACGEEGHKVYTSKPEYVTCPACKRGQLRLGAG